MNVSKAVLITGCSSGIGWATAKRLSEVGCRVYATARNIENIAPLEESGCRLLALDVTGGVHSWPATRQHCRRTPAARR